LSNFGNPCSHANHGVNCCPALYLFSCLFPCADFKRSRIAFRSTGSPPPVAAIIYTLHTITQLLENNPYVAVYAMDFSKASDSVCHFTLTGIAVLDLPDHVYNWLVSFFSGYCHGTKITTSSKHIRDDHSQCHPGIRNYTNSFRRECSRPEIADYGRCHLQAG